MYCMFEVRRSHATKSSPVAPTDPAACDVSRYVRRALSEEATALLARVYLPDINLLQFPQFGNWSSSRRNGTKEGDVAARAVRAAKAAKAKGSGGKGKGKGKGVGAGKGVGGGGPSGTLTKSAERRGASLPAVAGVGREGKLASTRTSAGRPGGKAKGKEVASSPSGLRSWISG